MADVTVHQALEIALLLFFFLIIRPPPKSPLFPHPPLSHSMRVTICPFFGAGVRPHDPAFPTQSKRGRHSYWLESSAARPPPASSVMPPPKGGNSPASTRT